MKEEKKKRKAGRPTTKIDIEMVKKLSMIMCSPKEIAYIVECDYRTLMKHHGEIIEKGRANGKMALRRKQ